MHYVGAHLGTTLKGELFAITFPPNRVEDAVPSEPLALYYFIPIATEYRFVFIYSIEKYVPAVVATDK